MSAPTRAGRANGALRSDALVIFGFTGDLASRKIFPALYAMVKKGTLTVPVIGVASSAWSTEQMHQRVRDSVAQEGSIDDTSAFDRLVSLLLQPASAIALAVRVKHPGKKFLGDQRELFLCEDASNEESTYERLLGDAMAGDEALFTSQDGR